MGGLGAYGFAVEILPRRQGAFPYLVFAYDPAGELESAGLDGTREGREIIVDFDRGPDRETWMRLSLPKKFNGKEPTVGYDAAGHELGAVWDADRAQRPAGLVEVVDANDHVKLEVDFSEAENRSPLDLVVCDGDEIVGSFEKLSANRCGVRLDDPGVDSRLALLLLFDLHERFGFNRMVRFPVPLGPP